MNKIKVIDLLNMISKGEEVPKKIKYKNKIYEWKEYDVCYGKIMTKKGWVKEHGYVAEENRTYFYLKHCYQDLNDEVEILEEEPRDIKVCGSLFTKSEYDKLAQSEEEKKIPEKLDMVLLGQCDNWLQPTIKTDEKIRAELNPYVIDIIRENTLEIQHKFNELLDYLKSKGE